MKKQKKIYIDEDTERKLKIKAKEVGLEGRGWLSNYLEKISNERIIFIDKNLKEVLTLFNLVPN